MNSKEALENIRNGKFITCKICSNNYNQWLTGCMCCRNELSKSKELDIIEKDLDRLEKDNYKLQKALEIYSNNVTVYEEKGRYYMACCDGGCRGIEITKEEYMELILILYDFSNMFKNCSKLEPLPENKELEKEYCKLKGNKKMTTEEERMRKTLNTEYKCFTVEEFKSIRKDLEILEQYKSIEEEIGIDLIVLFTALKNGVYYFDEQGQLIHDYVWLVNDYVAEGVPDKLSFSFKTSHNRQVLLFEEYGKTWALYKQQLPEEELKKVRQMTYLQKLLIENMNEFCSEKFDLSYERTQEEAEEYIIKNIDEYKSITTPNWY